MSRHFILCLCLCVLVSNAALLRADDEPKSKAQSVKTDRLDFPPGGTLRLDNSVGELTIAGWDRPDIVTTEFPGYSIFPPPLPWRRDHANFDLEYRINAPRDARLVVDHKTGQVHIDNSDSEISRS